MTALSPRSPLARARVRGLPAIVQRARSRRLAFRAGAMQHPVMLAHRVAIFATVVAFIASPAFGSPSTAVSDCVHRPDAARAVAALAATMADGRFVAYHPTSLQLIDGAWTEADPASVRADLALLRPHFAGVITYGSAHGADRIADVAAELHYRAVILGVWDVDDAAELDPALAAAARHPDLVFGLALGNERVFAKT